MRLAVLALLCVAVAVPGRRPQATPTTFVIQSDVDTIVAERITRTPTTITGDLRLYQEGGRAHYVVHLRADGSAETVEVRNDRPNFFTGTFAFSGVAASAARASAPTGAVAVAPSDAYPVIGISIGLIEQIIHANLRPVGDSATVKAINIRNHNLAMITIAHAAKDSVRVDCEGCMRVGQNERLLLALSKDGDVIGGIRQAPYWVITRH